MKKLVISALAASLTSAAALASESEWADLDRDVQALSASLSGLESSGIKFDGRIRMAYTTSSDVMVGPNDLGDFEILESRLKATGSRGDIGYVLQVDFSEAGTSGLLKDAYVNVPVGSGLTVRAGQFKGIISRSALLSSGKLFFTDRNQIGGLFSSRREGVALMGSFDTFDWAVTIQDGSDGAGDEYLLALHGNIDFLGEGVDMIDGAYGAGEEIEGTAGVSYWDDGTLNDGTGILFEGAVASNMYSAQIWFADIDKDLYTGNGSAGYLMADTTPFGIMGTFMVTQPTESQGGWEVGVRYQDMDDTSSTDILDLGVNYYGCGHNYKYFLHWQSVGSDNAALEADFIRIGMQIGF